MLLKYKVKQVLILGRLVKDYQMQVMKNDEQLGGSSIRCLRVQDSTKQILEQPGVHRETLSKVGKKTHWKKDSFTGKRIPIIPVLRMVRQKDRQTFEAILVYNIKPFLEKQSRTVIHSPFSCFTFSLFVHFLLASSLISRLATLLRSCALSSCNLGSKSLTHS